MHRTLLAEMMVAQVASIPNRWYGTNPACLFNTCMVSAPTLRSLPLLVRFRSVGWPPKFVDGCLWVAFLILCITKFILDWLSFNRIRKHRHFYLLRRRRLARTFSRSLLRTKAFFATKLSQNTNDQISWIKSQNAVWRYRPDHSPATKGFHAYLCKPF